MREDDRARRCVEGTVHEGNSELNRLCHAEEVKLCNLANSGEVKFSDIDHLEIELTYSLIRVESVEQFVEISDRRAAVFLDHDPHPDPHSLRHLCRRRWRSHASMVH